MHARDRLHHPPVAQAKPEPVDVLHPADVRGPVFGDRDVRVLVDRAGHAGRPQELVAELAVDELVDLAEVLLQLPGARERRRHELDQGFGVVGRDVRVGQGRAERRRMGRLRDPAVGPDPERLPFDALEAPGQDAALAGVHEARQAAFEASVQAGSGHKLAILRSPANLRNRWSVQPWMAPSAGVN